MPDLGILAASSAGSRRGGPSFSLKNRLERAAWSLSWCLLSQWTPPPLHGWRRTVLRLFGAQVAQNARVYPTVRIWHPRNIEIGDNAVVGPRVTLYSMAKITIGPDAVISQGAHLCTGTHDPDDRDFQLLALPIDVQSGAWIAAEAFVGPGVKVGAESVLGARSVTFKSLDAGSIYVGNPARFVRKRNYTGSEG